MIYKITWKSELNIVAKELTLGNGPLKVMVKDSIDIQGEQTLLGSRSRLNAEAAQQHAEVVKRVLDSDCQITAKTTMHELAFGITGINTAMGTPLNPKYPDLIPGGSSSGSAAAVAAGLADFSLGTDTGGSIRMPAACCGVYGLKPTFGRVSREGVWPASTSLDCVGPFAGTIDLLIQGMQIIDPSFTAAQHQALSTWRLAVLDVQAEAEVWHALQPVLSDIQPELPRVEAASMLAAYDAGMKIINHETWGAFAALTETGLVADDVNQRLLNAAKTTDEEVAAADQVRKQFTQEIDQLLEHYDALLLPTLPQIPPRLADAANTVAFLNLTSLVRPFNLSGHPALTIPYETAQGQPVGLQLITKHHADELLCEIARAIVAQTKAIAHGDGQ